MVSWDSLHMRLCCLTRPVIWAQTPCRPAAWSACTPSSSTRRPGPLLPSSPMFLQSKQKKVKIRETKTKFRNLADFSSILFGKFSSCHSYRFFRRELFMLKRNLTRSKILSPWLGEQSRLWHRHRRAVITTEISASQGLGRNLASEFFASANKAPWDRHVSAGDRAPAACVAGGHSIKELASQFSEPV